LLLPAFLSLAGCADSATSEEDAQPAREAVHELTTAQAMAAMGPLYLSEGKRTAEAKIKPWSSWWYPLWDDFLFQDKNGRLAPLQKYDLFNYWFLHRRTNAAALEHDEIYDAKATSWAGLCDAWALASIMEPEPTTTRGYSSLDFSVADQKALLLKTYEKVPDLTIVGERYNGDWNDTYEDVLPHVFHRVLELELFEKGEPFIIDTDASYEVWNAPVYKAVTKVSRDAHAESVMHVQTWLVMASPHVDDYNYTGTMSVTRDYTYDLRGRWKEGKFVVDSGVWTGRSRWDHPDYIIPKPTSVARGSRNTQLDVAVVDLILGRQR